MKSLGTQYDLLTWISLALSVLSIILSAIPFIVLMLLRRLKPQIIASEQLEKNVNDSGKTYYRIKIVNTGKYDAINVKAQLNLIRRTKDNPNGINMGSVLLDMDEKLNVPKYDQTDRTCAYAESFFTYVNIESLLVDVTYSLKLAVSFQNVKSVNMGIVEAEYGKNNIKTGLFKRGISFEIC